jgi:TPP-dependent indolepyruvate ferredoxin oxidoreductase alpha subunit
MEFFTTFVAAGALTGDENTTGYHMLVILAGEDHGYYSSKKTHEKLVFFKKPRSIMIYPDEIVIYSKNGKQMLVIPKI